MGTFVVDASVIVKWLLADPENESDTERATALMSAVVAGEHQLLQPVHWLAEVAAVLARVSPSTASEATLVTADRRYRQQVQGFGRLVDLREWS
jgi:predicted nucleic acid-binding protein